ncbi:MAG: hypothetical protein JRN13_06495 [Nitrososphaerota archaeon]|jgi:hypothetical protein|nr:hypothetical protein [Nitrososphaerota archaeon]MDG6957371.1 hypothetical protein [Nitrososphaerota archaeon]MDG6959502.1 hypothetical protein [Nitrososphaerota archaeon]MDG6969361.1 hypothetical protein [Nitrososphaerota archaeon]MDG6972966.1 hypothetical protein [Nitrososphaerota archaeon]
MKSVRDALKRAVGTTQKTIEKATPVIQKSLDASMEAAASAFTKTMKTIDGATTGDQETLLRAYRKLLAGQLDYVEARTKALEERQARSSQQTQPPVDTEP